MTYPLNLEDTAYVIELRKLYYLIKLGLPDQSFLSSLHYFDTKQWELNSHVSKIDGLVYLSLNYCGSSWPYLTKINNENSIHKVRYVSLPPPTTLSSHYFSIKIMRTKYAGPASLTYPINLDDRVYVIMLIK